MLSLYLAALDTPEEKSRFEDFYYAHRSAMYHAAYRILGDVAGAEDIVHEAFLRMLVLPKAIPEAHDPKARAYGIAVAENCAIDFYRKRKRRLHLPFEEELDDFAQPSFEEAVGDGDAVARAIAGLPPQYRSLLLLRYQMGFTPQEVADLLGKPLRAVYKSTERAKARLAERLREEGIER